MSTAEIVVTFSITCGRQVEEFQASFPSFVSPQSTQAESLGQRLAIDLLHLTTDLGSTLGLGTLSPAEQSSDSYNHCSWPAGCLTKEEGKALSQGASAILQQQLPGIVYDIQQHSLQHLQQLYPEVSWSLTGSEVVPI